MIDRAPLDRVDAAVARFFAGAGAAWASVPGVIAFSGGADSTALAAALARRARSGGPPVVAAHLDHGLDAESAARAAAAEAAARRLGLPFVAERRPPQPGERRAAGPEAAARRRRYRFLVEVARRHVAAWVATAHHRDDQAETVLLRLLFGSGIEGLAGIAPVAELAPGVALLRPLLDVGRRDVEAALEAAGIGWTEDPTNRDPAVPRNRVRHLLLPALARAEGEDPERIAERATRLAAAAAAARSRIEALLADRLDLRSAADPAGGTTRTAAPDLAAAAPSPALAPLVGPFAAPTTRAPRPTASSGAPPPPPSLDLAALAALPPPLLTPALALLHRAAGIPYPPPAAAVRELARQLAERRPPSAAAPGSPPPRRPLAADAGRGWRWHAEGGRLVPRRAERAATSAVGYSYTLPVPGELDVPEAGVRVRVGQQPPAPWMLRGSRRRAALALPLAAGETVVVRSRRPGDRLRPLGAAGTRRLKDLLIDHRVPRRERDRLPLLCLGADGAEIAWVPGVTIDHRHRLATAAGDFPGGGAAESPVWVAEIVPLAAGDGGIGGWEQPLFDAR
jgi:tRNA(Ile)-lysidine synthase